MKEIITVRDIEMVTSEINYVKRQGARQLLSNMIEIGRLLVEAKSMVAHGEWGKYLEERVDYSQSTANNLMKLYQEYGDNQESFFGSLQNSQAFGKLSYTQALALLVLPAEEREEFAEEHDPEKMSSREWEKAIRQKDEELQEAQRKKELSDEAAVEAAAALEAQTAETDRLKKAVQDAEGAKKDAQAKLEKLQAQLKKARENEKVAKDALAMAKEHPEIPESMMEEMRQQVAADAAKQATEELQKQLDQAKRDADAKAEQLQAAEEKLQAAQKAVQLANPDVAVFKTLFTQVQKDFETMLEALKNAKQVDPEAGEKLCAAVKALLDKLAGDLVEVQSDV